MKNKDRIAAKAFADANNYFWLPCPRCGEWFGGHEWERGHEHDVSCVLDESVGHGACCTKVSDEADRESCRRSHEMHGEPSTVSRGNNE